MVTAGVRFPAQHETLVLPPRLARAGNVSWRALTSCLALADGRGFLLLAVLTVLLPLAGTWAFFGSEALRAFPLVNIDLPVIVALSAGLRWRAVPILGVATLDIAARFGKIYGFSAHDVLANLANTSYVDPRIALGVVTFGLVLTAAASGTARRLGGRIGPRLLVIAATGGLVVLDAALGTSALRPTAGATIDLNLAGSGAYSLVQLQRMNEAEGAVDVAAVPPGTQPTGAPAELLAGLRAGQAPAARRVALVVIESYGLPHDEALRAWIEAPLRDAVAARGGLYETATSPFAGATVYGEHRVLCGLLNVRRADDAAYAQCTPSLLRERGWRTVAVHGNALGFYHRASWWPRAGFAQVWGRDQLAREGAPAEQRCAQGFVGVCDPATGRFVGEQLGAPVADGGGVLVYWLTLNSHLPTGPRPASERCSDIPLERPSPVLCAWLYSIRDVFATIATWRADGEPIAVYVAGDHAPPATMREVRELFRDDLVPTTFARFR